MSTRSGFTLLEVLVALTIVVTAWAGIAAALPQLIGPSPAERAALAVEGVLRQAREAAHEGRSPVTVRLQDGGRTVAAPSLGARADLPSDIVARLEGVRGWGSSGKADAFGANDEAAIVFLPDGASSGGRVTLSDRTLSAAATMAASDAPFPTSAPTSTSPIASVHVSWLTSRIERR
jgi:prepilin-type N-terminal cleavage/methylation domain-containing protein